MNGLQPADEDLVVLVTRGDDSAITLLYDRHARAVYSLTLKVVHNKEVAEELTQEVFLRVWQQASTYHRDRGRFISWVLGIAHHIAIDELRRRKSRPQQVYAQPDDSRPMFDVADQSPLPDEMVMGGLRRERIVEVLAELPRNQREVIELSYFGGLTQSEIAERTHEPLGTIKTRTRLALQRLRGKLTEEGERPENL